MGRTMEADVDLALKALAQKAVGDGTQIVNALTDGYLYGSASGGCGSRIKIRQAG